MNGINKQNQFLLHTDGKKYTINVRLKSRFLTSESPSFKNYPVTLAKAYHSSLALEN